MVKKNVSKLNSTLNFIITKNGFDIDSYNTSDIKPVIDGNITLAEEEAQLKELFEKDKFHALYTIGFKESKDWYSESLRFLHSISAFYNDLILKTRDLEFLRENVRPQIFLGDIYNVIFNAPFMVGSEHIEFVWVKILFDQFLDIFTSEIKSFNGSVESYFSQKNQNLQVPERIFFHLKNTPDEDSTFAFMATYSSQKKNKKIVHTSLSNALIEYQNDEHALLRLISPLIKISEQSSFINKLMETGEIFHPIKISIDEAYNFLKETPIYKKSGVLCRVPIWWLTKSNSFKLNMKIENKNKSFVGLDTFLSLDYVLKVDDVTLSYEEVQALLSQTEGLINLKGKWIEIDHKKISEILENYDNLKEKFNSKEFSFLEALKMELNPSHYLDKTVSNNDISISNGKWMGEMLLKLRNPNLEHASTLPDYLSKMLRNYQKIGFTWLKNMYNLGLGACLADDMGLGKTIQILALLEDIRLTNDKANILLIVPASLLGNWENEIKKFTPLVPYNILHGKSDFKDIFLTITTYGMVKNTIKTSEEFKDKIWDLIILDEAQAIKNSGTKQTKSIKELKSKRRIAMTGTPIENNLSDIWSLFDFLNSGLLGNAKEFKSFIDKLHEKNSGYDRLRTILSPFILRRLKTNSNIISDLPEKIEIKELINLSSAQIILYKKLINDLKENLENSEGIKRKGLVLSAIMKSKQICNHPDQYLVGSEFSEKASGKFERLKEICEVIYEKREKVLIFTQFKEMTEPLSEFLETIFHKKGLIIHGGVPPKKRTEIVNLFNSDTYVPFMVLSLKAGGVGLNLTSANYVIHFDRWWNPAVEDQATDRAFRIGQKKNVMVYKMISKDTIEEKIDEMIENKKSLSKDIISQEKETWITELSNDEIINLFTLTK